MKTSKVSRPIISMIAAMAKNRVIGKNNQMPWHLPADLQHFKKITLGKPIIMGRHTFESIGKPLPGRKNIVITSQQDYSFEGIEVFHSLDKAIDSLLDSEEIIIMGGGRIYQQMLVHADRLYLTHIDYEVEGDTFFPEYKSLGWDKISKETRSKDENNLYDCTFVTLQRNH